MNKPNSGDGQVHTYDGHVFHDCLKVKLGTQVANQQAWQQQLHAETRDLLRGTRR